MIHMALFILATIFVIGVFLTIGLLTLAVAINYKAVRIILQTIAAAMIALIVGIWWNGDGNFHQIPAFITFWLIALQPFAGDDLKKFVKGG